MVIDLSTCIGCNACTIACQAENNIPVVGKVQVRAGREMHWIRVDTYYSEDAERPRIFIISRCRACIASTRLANWCVRSAATVHDDEGLNLQVYNRCVGTRYCSNNCPYKVRRFNFLEYNGDYTPSEKLVKESRRHRPLSWRHGKMHLLPATDQRGAHRGRAGCAGESRMAKSSPPARRSARRRQSSSAICTIRRVAWPREKNRPLTTACSRS